MSKLRFDVYWLGEVKDEKITYGHTVASSSTLIGARRFARMKKLTDMTHTIHEVSVSLGIEDIIGEHAIKYLDKDALSRATRDAAEKFTADAIAAGKGLKPEGFREYPEDYFDATELQDSDSYRDFVNQES